MTLSGFFLLLAVAMMAAVLISFLMGMFAMTRGAAGDAQRSNRMMRMRVFLQGGAILLLFLAVISK